MLQSVHLHLILIRIISLPVRLFQWQVAHESFVLVIVVSIQGVKFSKNTMAF